MSNKPTKCEICNIKNIILDTHHIQSRSKEGNNKKYNLCYLCPNCHRLVHEGKIILEGRYLTSNCKLGYTELIWRYSNEKSIDDLNKDPDVWIYGNKIKIG